LSRYNYNQQVSPAPFVFVAVARDDDGAAPHEHPAQIDTAADRTILPWPLIDELKLVPFREFEAMGLGGVILRLPSFLLRLAIRGNAPTLVEALASPEEPYILLGRDVLNGHRVILDGPRLLCDVE
jgi:hypothetical protein